MKKELSIVFPVFNNEKTLLTLLKEIEKEAAAFTPAYEVVIIDDASSDNSPSLLKKYAARHVHLRVFYHSVNCGTAATYKELYAKAGGNIVVLFSVDGEWDPKDIIRLANRIDKNTDIVIGRREQKAYRLGRKVVSFLFNCVGPVFFGTPTYDAGSIKALRKKVLQKTPVFSQSVFDEAERIIKAQKMGYHVTVIPVHHQGSTKLKRFFPKKKLMGEAMRDMGRLVMKGI